MCVIIQTLPSVHPGELVFKKLQINKTIIKTKELIFLTSIQSSIQLSVCPSIHPTMHPCIHSSNHPSIQPSNHSSNHPSIHPIIPPTVRPSTYPFNYPSIPLILRAELLTIYNQLIGKKVEMVEDLKYLHIHVHISLYFQGKH